jgi:hypothetical protein
VKQETCEREEANEGVAWRTVDRVGSMICTRSSSNRTAAVCTTTKAGSFVEVE